MEELADEAAREVFSELERRRQGWAAPDVEYDGLFRDDLAWRSWLMQHRGLSCDAFQGMVRKRARGQRLLFQIQPHAVRAVRHRTIAAGGSRCHLCTPMSLLHASGAACET